MLMRVVKDLGYGVYMLDNGNRYVWDFADNGITGTLTSADKTYTIISDERDDNDDVIVFNVANKI